MVCILLKSLFLRIMINTATDPMTIDELLVHTEPMENTQTEPFLPVATEELLYDRPKEFTRMELEEGEWTSIYIPVLSDKLVLKNHNDMVNKFQPKFLRDFLEKVLRIGKVRRIDYVDRDIPNSSTPVKAAFVHFEYWYDTQTARNLREKLNTYGQFRQKGYMYKGKRCNFYQHNGDINDTARPGYFDIRINHKPIEETECDWNIHQLYAENKRLEEEMSIVQDANLQMQQTMEEQRCMICNMQTEMNYYRSLYLTNENQNNMEQQSGYYTVDVEQGQPSLENRTGAIGVPPPNMVDTDDDDVFTQPILTRSDALSLIPTE